MQRFRWSFLLTFLIACSFCLEAKADSFSFTGTFAHDDDIQLFNFQLLNPSTVTIQTFGYAGGTNGAGASIADGGFDPMISVFDATGDQFQLAANDDSGCSDVGTDPTTGACFDSFLILPSLDAGSYILALTQYPNSALGPTLGDGFAFAGLGDFTCEMFTGGSGPFCDVSLDQRDSHWALDISGVDSASQQTTAVPEPISGILLLPAVAVVFSHRFRKS